MDKNMVEKFTVSECVKNPEFTQEAYQLNLEHIVRKNWYEVQSQSYGNHPIRIAEKHLNDCKQKLLNVSDLDDDEIETLNMQKQFYEKQIDDIKKQALLGINDYRVKDLVTYALEIKAKEQLKRINENMLNIESGDSRIHNKKMKQLQTIYNFDDDAIMKISCWLTQVKRTAHDLPLQTPTALVFYSAKKCTGKSTLMTIIKKAILSSYQENVHLKNFSLEKLFSRFKPIELVQDLVITIDEIGWLTKDITADFKSLITDTNEIEIEKKFKDPIFGRKLANFIITSNDEPSDLFYTDIHERRLSIIDDFMKTKDISENELFDIVNEIWKSTPIDYAYNTDILMEKNMNRQSTNDDIFEALYNMCGWIGGETPEFSQRYFTVASFRDLYYDEFHIDLNKKRIKNYFETSPHYFQCMRSGKVVRYKPLQALLDDLKKELESHIEAA